MLGPPLLIGEKVFYSKRGFIASGTVKWLGRLQEVFGNQMIAGLLMVRHLRNSILAVFCCILLYSTVFCTFGDQVHFFQIEG